MKKVPISRITLHSSQTVTCIFCAWCCLLLFSLCGSAVAQRSDALRCSYEPKPDIASALRMFQLGGPAGEAATVVLGQAGVDALPALMAFIPQYMQDNVNSNSWSPAHRDFAIVLTDVIRAVLSGSRQAILRFRECRTDAIIKPLTWAARGDNQRLRVNAANILANVIDNTTVCFVLHHLRDKTISTPGRANLLGVTNSMASYAYKDNVSSIRDTLSVVNDQIGSKSGFDQTRSIIADIQTRMGRSENKDTSLRAASLNEYCEDYNFSAALD